MKAHTLKVSIILLALFFVTTTASAEVSWTSVRKKIQSSKDYRVDYSYSGPRGKFDFDYAYTTEAVRSEIVASKPDRSKIGTVILFDKRWNEKRIRAKTGSGLITRKLSHKEVIETPFYRSLLGMILEQVGSAKPTSKKVGGKTLFTFRVAGGSYRVWANSASEIVKTERQTTDGKETRSFSGYKWNSSPKLGF